jgi:apolipoprotein N-acyltransferase
VSDRIALVPRPGLRTRFLRHPNLAALGLGLVAALSLPPLNVIPALVAMAGLLALLQDAPGPWPAFRRGWCFGLGWFLAGLYWIGIAFFTDAERFGALAAPAILLLSGGLALFPGAAAFVLRLRRWRSIEAMACAWALLWVLAEALRGTYGLRFPWNPVSIVWSASPATMQPLAWLGTYGYGLVTVLLASLPATLLQDHGRRRWHGPVLAAAGTGLLVVLGVLRLALVVPPPDTGLELRLVQADIPQDLKWDSDKQALWLRRHVELSVRPAAVPPDLVIWPESAVPYPLEQDPVVRSFVARAAPAGGYLLTGGDRFDLDAKPPTANDSIFALDRKGDILARYDKVELVPFGEYLPFRSVLERLGLKKLTAGTIDFVPGPGRRTIRLPGVPLFSPLVCYEAIFPGWAIAPGTHPDWILNVTNDAWFGRSSGPYQHLAMARMRSVEDGLPLVRAANNGISVVTDAMGRVRARLGLDAMGVLDAPLPAALPGGTLYARHGWLTVAVAVLCLALAGALLEGRARGRS